MSLTIEGGRVLHPDHAIEEADVYIEDGVVREIGDDVPAGTESLDAEGGLVMPGLVNAHGHVAMTLLRGYADDKPLQEWLTEDIWPIEGELKPADVRAGAALGALEMIRSGTTAFADMYFHVHAVADAVAEAGLRARIGHGVVTLGKEAAEARTDFEESLRAADQLQGAADGRITTAVMPHAPHTVGTEFLEEYVPKTREAGVPLHFHLNETHDYLAPIAAETGQTPGAYADDLGMLTEEDWVAHGVHVSDEEIDLLAERGTGVVHCPASNMKLASGMAPIQKMLDAGVTVGLGTDGAASNNDLDMFDELRDAAMLGKLAADDASAVDAGTAVEMATQGSARATGLGSGRLEEGAAADCIVVDFEAPHLTPPHDLVSHLAYAVRGSDVRHTVCDGEVLMREREVLTLDEKQVREEAERRAMRAVDRT
ncbi:amidohydrolase [Natronomonas sp. EA1]|uniref:amidohydrolase n=1 Tax=Natronomonas sp. EA1 TaxID=3421655 RepID=UPI003EB7A508